MITTDTGEAYENEFHHAIDSPLPAVALNDNAPKSESTLPNLSGGLKGPPKPANDNDPRKPFGAASNKEDPPFDVIQNYIQMQKNIDTWAGPDNQKIPVYDWAARGVLPKSTDLSDVAPSPNIIKGKDGPPMSEEVRDTLTKQYYSNDPGKDTLGIGLSDVQDRIDEGVTRTEQRDAAALEHFNKAWKQIIPTPAAKKKTSQE